MINLFNHPLIHQINILEIPKRINYRHNRHISPGMNNYLRLHWTNQKTVRDKAKEFFKYQLENLPEMEYIEWEWSWGKSRFDNDNRHFFWVKMCQDVLKGWKIPEDTYNYINHCFYYVNEGQDCDLKMFIYGKVKK